MQGGRAAEEAGGGGWRAGGQGLGSGGGLVGCSKEGGTGGGGQVGGGGREKGGRVLVGGGGVGHGAFFVFLGAFAFVSKLQKQEKHWFFRGGRGGGRQGTGGAGRWRGERKGGQGRGVARSIFRVLGAFALFLNCRKEKNTGFFVGEGEGKGRGREVGLGPGRRSGRAGRGQGGAGSWSGGGLGG